MVPTGHSEYDGAALHEPPAGIAAGSHCGSLAAYKAMYERSIRDPQGFWGETARSTLHWFRDFQQV